VSKSAAMDLSFLFRISTLPHAAISCQDIPRPDLRNPQNVVSEVAQYRMKYGKRGDPYLCRGSGSVPVPQSGNCSGSFPFLLLVVPDRIGVNFDESFISEA
jgi:hypothetical protein